MGNLYKRAEIATFEFIFLDAQSHEPIDVNSPTYVIVYFSSNVEQVIVPTTPLTRVDTGKYTASWSIPLSAPVNETYFVRATAIHPVSFTSTILEDSFKVVSDDYFTQGGSGGSSGLTIKFTKD
jgi:hypothetical protein